MKMSTKPKDLDNLQSLINIKFKNPSLLKNAFIHRSYLNENKNFKSNSNERLEFLGDAVLSVVVSKHLYDNLPTSQEGQLTQLRASLVRRETLASLSTNLSLGKFLLLSKGEEESGGRTNETILANTFEALLGAVYLDQGFEVTHNFINQQILDKWQTLAKSAVVDNKSRLQEVLQKNYHQSPVYKLTKSWGPDHNRRFEIAAYIADKLLGKGIGKNKQIAAQNAAKDALTRLKTQVMG